MFLKTFALRKLGQGKLLWANHAPEIMCGIGTVAFVATVISAIKETPKFEKVLEEHNELIAKRRKTIEGVKNGTIKTASYTSQDSIKDLGLIYIKTGAKALWAYKWTLLLGAVAIGSFWCGFIKLHKIAVGLGAAYSALALDNEHLENAVKETYGEDALLKLKSKSTDVVETKKNEETGETVTESYSILEDTSVSSKLFDSSNKNWEDDPEANAFFLRQKQNWANYLLNRDGFLLLNTVYELLEMEPTQEGCVKGWKLYDDEEDRIANGGSNFVSFGIWEGPGSEINKRFVEGSEPNVWLILNTDREPIVRRVGMAVA